jgi:hypothetical protein
MGTRMEQRNVIKQRGKDGNKQEALLHHALLMHTVQE